MCNKPWNDWQTINTHKMSERERERERGKGSYIKDNTEAARARTSNEVVNMGKDWLTHWL